MAEREDIALLISGVVRSVLFGITLVLLAVTSSAAPVLYAVAIVTSCILTPHLSWWIAGRMAGEPRPGQRHSLP
jgi:hypothetical protein